MTASGTFGYGQEFAPLLDINRLGAIVVKGLSLTPAAGNPPPRIVETASGMLNAIGLENVGLEAFVEQKLPYFKRLKIPVVANIYGKTVAEYAQLAESLEAISEIAALEVNISCPNVKAGGVAFGVDPAAAFEVVAAVRGRTTKPMLVKLSPNVTDIAQIAVQVEKAGADAVSLINTITGLAVDIKSRRPILANITGGLSGPAIKPVALRMVWQVCQAVNIPVVGIGGIMNATDAIEFLMVGAAAIQVGTANFVNPRTSVEIIDGIKAFMVQEKIAKMSELIGTLVV